ncbi:MAG: hypothetical protein BGO08_12595 [Altererythrobacter sp. 66-12]|nr:MAG: hypothetical protein BGO08_12595 [Altererythrobacter sp. 66-12]
MPVPEDTWVEVIINDGLRFQTGPDGEKHRYFARDFFWEWAVPAKIGDWAGDARCKAFFAEYMFSGWRWFGVRLYRVMAPASAGQVAR